MAIPLAPRTLNTKVTTKADHQALEAEIIDLAKGSDLRMYHRLCLILTYDRSGGWIAHGATSCAVWLADACDIERSTAREQLRVARALAELPLIAAAFAAGHISYTKVRMLTREATPENEADRWVTQIRPLSTGSVAPSLRNGAASTRCLL